MALNIIEFEPFKETYRCYVGDTFDAFNLTFRNADDKVPFDFTAATAVAHFKKNRNDAVSLLTITEQDAISLGNDVENLKIVLTEAQTTALGEGTFLFNVRLTQAGKTLTYADCVLILTESL